MLPPTSPKKLCAAVERNLAGVKAIIKPLHPIPLATKLGARADGELLAVFLGYMEALADDGYEVSIERLDDEISFAVQEKESHKVHEVRGPSLVACLNRAIGEDDR